MKTVRNPVVRHATITRKGGAHQRSATSARQQARDDMHDELDDYLRERAERNQEANAVAPKRAPQSYSGLESTGWYSATQQVSL